MKQVNAHEVKNKNCKSAKNNIDLKYIHCHITDEVIITSNNNY